MKHKKTFSTIETFVDKDDGKFRKCFMVQVQMECIEKPKGGV